MARVELVCIARVDGRTIWSHKESKAYRNDFELYERHIPWVKNTLEGMSVEACHAVSHYTQTREGGELMAEAAMAFCEVCGDEFDADELNEEGLCKECEDASYEDGDDDE